MLGHHCGASTTTEAKQPVLESLGIGASGQCRAGFRPRLARMSGGIYLLRGEDELLEMTEQPYDSEEILQALIAKFPSLLAGDQYGADAPRRWLLIGREAALPGEEDGGGRWSVDHLFLDQDAVPTIVEVKRSSDTRIRREVIGQMLDYAANAVVYWPIGRLRELFIRRAEHIGRDPDELVADAEQAGENLRAGKLRLVFVADQIPSELRRVIEFLNGQMFAEVLGIEVRQYVGEGVKTLVPRVIGQTAEVEARKGRRSTGGPGRRWDEQSLFADLEARRGADEARAARDLYDWTCQQGVRATFGAGKQDGSWTPVILANGREYPPIVLYSYGRCEVQFQYLLARPPFDNEQTRLELLRRVNEIPGVSFGPEVITKRPSISLAVLAGNPQALEQLKAVLRWLAETAASHAT
jgi:hypothetical protein